MPGSNEESEAEKEVSIIIEGPDGAGKTTLLSELHSHFPRMEQHPRFCTSVGGPIEGLAEEVFRDTKSRPTHFLYDRHPVISEYIYSFATSRPIKSGFLENTMGQIRNRVAHHSVVIWCLPPRRVVKQNLEHDDQMPGVIDNIDLIYDMYQMHRLLWPGRHCVYDYTRLDTSWQGLTYTLNDSRNILWKECP